MVYGISKHLTATWIAQEQVQFLLDGLDEMEASARTACIEAINTYRKTHMVPLVVCSRSQEYESQRVRLILPGAVEIQPLEPAQITKVLKQADKSLAAVRAALRSNAILSELLTTPLMLNIVILTYHDKTLKELPQRGLPQEQQREIFEQYVQSMLKRYRKQRSFSLAQTITSLVWLAQQMQQRHLTEFHLESLQADWLSTRRSQITYRLFSGLVFGLLIGLSLGLTFGLLSGLTFGLLSGLTFGLLSGLTFGLLGGLVSGRTQLKPVEKFAWSWIGCGRGLVIGLVFGLVIVLFGGLAGGLVLGLLGWLVGGLAGWLVSGRTEFEIC